MKFSLRRCALAGVFITFTAMAVDIPLAGRLDVTSEYKTTWESINELFDTLYVERLREHRVLFVRGFLSSINSDLNEQQNWLESIGVSTERVKIGSAETIEHNAAIITEAIKSSDLPVILFTHSKGGLDSLEALLSERTLKLKLHGWITVQTPFLGSPLADMVLSNQISNFLATLILRSLGGTRESLKSLKTDIREEYYQQNYEQILTLLSKLPHICFASYINDEPWRLDTMLELPRNILLRQGYDNDGLVPLYSAILPESDFVILEGVDHAAPVRNIPGSPVKFDKIRFTKTLFAMLLNRIEVTP